jgi:hypothetical protein
MIKDNKRYCDRCGVELTKRNNVCGFELCDKCNEVLGQQLAIKNDLVDEQHKGDIMEFPKTFDEFANLYGFKDKDEVYTNGSELIPVFRVKQWLEHISTTKNNLGVEEITALAEWTAKLTKASEDAYNKGYADGVKSVNICPHCGEYIGEEE